MHSFTLDGVNCRSYGISISGEGTYNAPKRDIESIPVPGRNGDLTIDHERFENITVTYPAIIYGNFARNARQARAWLCSVPGYRRLQDDYDLETFRLARFISGLEIKPWANSKEGEAQIQFDCDPRRFLLSGETIISKDSSGGYITNPTLFDALPVLTVKGSGSGTVTVGGVTVAISDISTSVTLDCEICRAYNGTTPRDDTITDQYPKLHPGRNYIRWTGGVTSVEITPRWWTV